MSNDNIDLEELKVLADKLIAKLQSSKPMDRSELARRYAIAITDAEKLHAWIMMMAIVESEVVNHKAK